MQEHDELLQKEISDLFKSFSRFERIDPQKDLYLKDLFYGETWSDELLGERYYKVILGLPKAYRVALEMKIEGYPDKKIARILDVTCEHLTVILSRVRDKIICYSRDYKGNEDY